MNETGSHTEFLTGPLAVVVLTAIPLFGCASIEEKRTPPDNSVSQAELHETWHPRVVHGDDIPFAYPLQPVYQVPPRYPVEALKGCYGGVVVVELLLAENGRVSDIEVIRADENNVFAQPVVRSVWQWRFRPHLEDGVASPSRAVLPVEFKKPDGCRPERT